MSDATKNVVVRINSDGSGLVTTAKAGAEAVGQLAEATRKATDETKRAREENMRAKEAEAARRFETSQSKKLLEESAQTQKAVNEEAARFVQRLKEQAATLSMTKIQVEQYKAAQLDLNAAQRASVEGSLATLGAHDKQEKTMAMMTRGALAAGAAIGAYAVSTVRGVKAVIDQADGFNKLSQSLGVSTEFLSAYTYQGQLAGVSQQEMSASARGLVRNMQEAAAGTGNGAAVFRALGEDILKAAKSGESLETLMPKIAERFAQFEDGPRKTALAIELFGRSGERMIPLLNGGAAGFTAMAREAKELNRIVGGDLAKRSEEFNDNLTRMNALLTASKYSIAKDALPALNDYLQKLIEISKFSGGIFGGALGMASVSGNEAANPGAAVTEMRDKLAYVQKKRDAYSNMSPFVQSLEFDNIAILDAQIAAFTKKLEILKVYQRQAALASVDGVDTSDQNSRMMQRSRTPAPVIEKEGRSRATAEAISDYDRLIKAINEKNAVQSVEDSIGRKLTAGERDALKIMTDLRDGTITFTEAQKLSMTGVLESTIAHEKANDSRERGAKELERLTAQHVKWLEAQEKATDRLEDQNAKLAEHNRTIGLSAEELRALSITRAEEALALAQQNEQIAMLDETFEGDINVMRRRTQAAREFLDLTREGAARSAWADQTRKMAEDSKRMQDNIERGLVDSIFRGFDKGRSFGRNFWDSMVSMAKTSILTPIIQPIMRPVAGAITGLVQGAIGSAFPSYASAAGGAGNAVGGASSLLRMGGQGFADFSNFFGSIGATTEAGTTFGLMDALGGFAAANPLLAAGLVLGGGALLGGLFEGGGPKASDASLRRRSNGDFGIEMNNVAGGDPDIAQVLAMNAALNDPTRFDPAKLAGFVDTQVSTGSPADTATLLSQLAAALAPAADSAREMTAATQALAASEKAAADAAAQHQAAVDNERQGLQNQLDQLTMTSAQLLEKQRNALDESNRALFDQVQAATAAAAATQAQVQAEQAAADEAARVASERYSLESELLQLQGNTAELRARELAGLDASNRALKEQIYATQDLTTAQQNQASAASAAANELATAERSLTSNQQAMQSAVNALPAKLGIDALTKAQQGLAVSEYNAPLDRVAAARSLLDQTYASARGGDLAAVQAFPQQLQSALSIARDAFASGPDFQEIFLDGNRKLNDLLQRQNEVQVDLLKDVPLTIQQASNDQIAAMREGFKALLAEWQSLRAELRRLVA